MNDLLTNNACPGEAERLSLSDEIKRIEGVATELYSYCKKRNWAGYDPYDALNSRIFRLFPFLNIRLFRLALTQGVKRFPVNLRPCLLVPQSESPKGVALFLSALIRLTQIGLTEASMDIDPLSEKLLALRSPYEKYSCWGYNFDWQSRVGFLPRGYPNIICTTFAAEALLDLYETSKNSTLLDIVNSAADYILHDLYSRVDKAGSFFSYTSAWRTEVHNANLLGAALLCRVAKVTGRRQLIEPALDATRTSVAHQQPDGSWPYGQGISQAWIDNFHTGYNLVALNHIERDAETHEFRQAIERGFSFYRKHFFREDGAPKYFHNATFPIDIHSVAQGIITLLEYYDICPDNLNLALSVLRWAIKNMWDDRGYFYYQQRPLYRVRTPFMRWSQAWMLLALGTLFSRIRQGPSESIAPTGI